jgi:hypothetical protein
VTANVAAVLANISTLDAVHERLRRSGVVARAKAIVLGKQLDTPGRLRLMLALLIANIAGGRLEEAGAIEGEVEEEAEEVVGRGAAYDFVAALLNALQLSANEKCFLGQRCASAASAVADASVLPIGCAWPMRLRPRWGGAVRKVEGVRHCDGAGCDRALR